MAGFAGAGGAIGPLLGGFLLEHFWYGSVFFVAVPIAAVAFVASAILAPRSREEVARPLDPAGATLSIVGFGALLYAIIEGPARGWLDVQVVLGFVVAALGLAGFVVYEQHREDPMLDMRHFRLPRFAMGSVGITFTFLAMFSMFFVLTQYLQYVRGHSPLGAGVRGLPFAGTMIVVSPRSAELASRVGVRRLVPAGMGVMAVGLVLLSFVTASTPYWYVAACLVLMACGVGVAMPSLSSGIVQSVPMQQAGVGSAVNDTTREVGGAIGIALVGSIVTSVYRHRLGDALDVLPPHLADVARDNVGKALGVAAAAGDQLGPEAGGALVEQVRDAFVSGAHVGLRVAAAIVLAAAFVVRHGLRQAVDAPSH